MSLTIILIITAIVLTTIGVRIYLEEKNKAPLKKDETIVIDKNQEQIVAERIAEITAFENEVAEKMQTSVKTETENVKLVTEQKKSAKKKRYYSPKKSQAKGKNKK